jgi:hypothetical protein
MNQSIAIIIAGALIAVAIMLTNHWTLLAPDQSTLGDALLLNRWTGAVVACRHPVGARFNEKMWDCGPP